jgi:putative hydrolase of the HAD superfamily
VFKRGYAPFFPFRSKNLRRKLRTQVERSIRRKYTAVIFDLFGTLVEKFPLDAYRKELREMADAISAPQEEFIRWWFATYNDRGMGVFQSYEANIEYICGKIEITADSAGIRRAIEICREYAKYYLKTRPYAEELLADVRVKGLKTGLISDCGVEIAKLYDDFTIAPLLDVAVLSCRVGTQKPDPRIYRVATERLDVRPEDCLYIGDGDDNELSGATQAGMTAVLIRDPGEDRDNVYRENYEGDMWQGPVITSLQEVLKLL